MRQSLGVVGRDVFEVRKPEAAAFVRSIGIFRRPKETGRRGKCISV